MHWKDSWNDLSWGLLLVNLKWRVSSNLYSLLKISNSERLVPVLNYGGNELS